MPAVIVMPADAPRQTRADRALGAEVVLYDRVRDDRQAIARSRASAAPCWCRLMTIR
jgi:threonine dehydratase